LLTARYRDEVVEKERVMKRGTKWLFLVLGVVFMLLEVGAFAQKQKVYGFVTPGPDTWYKKTVDGFVYAAEKVGAKTIVLNSDYNAEKEIANIDSLINQGVDGMLMFSFNPNGAFIAAQKCAKAHIPLVVDGNVGQVLKSGTDIVACVDFDWAQIGTDVAKYIATTYPGEDVAVIMGLFEHVPVQFAKGAFEKEAARLGKNKIVSIRDGKYDPNEAVNQAQDLIQSGQKFSVLFIFNEEMGAAVVRMLKTRGLLNNPIKVITTNGAPYGIELIKDGSIKFSISTSPGWDGMIDLLALHSYATGKSKKINQQIMLPNVPITPQTINDKMKVVPWDVDPVWFDLTKKYFPAFNGLY
jgi:ribose transport system substrate-binding protein